MTKTKSNIVLDTGRDRNFVLQIEVATELLALRPSRNVRSEDRDWDRDQGPDLQNILR